VNLGGFEKGYSDEIPVHPDGPTARKGGKEEKISCRLDDAMCNRHAINSHDYDTWKHRRYKSYSSQSTSSKQSFPHHESSQRRS
jgi:hypothetical protein